MKRALAYLLIVILMVVVMVLIIDYPEQSAVDLPYGTYDIL